MSMGVLLLWILISQEPRIIGVGPWFSKILLRACDRLLNAPFLLRKRTFSFSFTKKAPRIGGIIRVSVGSDNLLLPTVALFR